MNETSSSAGDSEPGRRLSTTTAMGGLPAVNARPRSREVIGSPLFELSPDLLEVGPRDAATAVVLRRGQVPPREQPSHHAIRLTRLGFTRAELRFELRLTRRQNVVG